ncbi:hypothetical protein MUK42_37785 [Musa troglodytarum]|uniref:Uncharacterized protein n=1 Tax=Musa troglodytarum TaxID=320322 RepID=A0A9E7H0E2_9LILI|nr:hypothetical protein MUK42_37785 [Musa troglodytarum]
MHLGILRQPEPPRELAAAPLHVVPLVALLLLLTPLTVDLEDPAFLHLHLHLLLLHPRQVNLEAMSLRRLLPINACVSEGVSLMKSGHVSEREQKASKGRP